ncbi:MAG: peptidoglycan DD-metalloendopeptidase family protein [Patescibacteria group bacterium]
MRTNVKLFFILAIVGTLAVSLSSTSHAETAEELKQKITSKAEEIKQLEVEIKKYQEQIGTLGTEKVTLKKLITELDLTRKKLETELRITKVNVDATSLQIDQLGSQIFIKEREISSRRESLGEMIRLVHERDVSSLPTIVLSHDSLSDFLNNIESLNQFNEAVQENVALLKGYKTDLQNKQGAREVEKKKLLNFKDELSDRKKIVEVNKNDKAQLLTETSNQESSYKKILVKKVALKDAFEKELDEYESTLKFILDPSLIPPRGVNVFSSPLDNPYITQRFGKTSASGRLYVSGSHNGVDFRAPLGTPVKAMASGTVIGSGNTDLTCRGASYGNWILIRYNNGLSSVYGHLSLVKGVEGQTVSAGDVVAYSGNTGYSTGPHLHVSLYASSAVTVKTLPSRSCDGRMYTLPMAAPNAYLDLLDYFIF